MSFNSEMRHRMDTKLQVTEESANMHLWLLIKEGVPCTAYITDISSLLKCIYTFQRYFRDTTETSQGTNYTHISAVNIARQQAFSDRGIFFKSKAQKPNPILISCQRSSTGDICMINAVQSVAVQQSWACLVMFIYDQILSEDADQMGVLLS